MRTVPAEIEPHLGDVHQTVFLLMELIGPVATYRYTTAPITVVWGGHTWATLQFDLSEFVTDSEGEMSCTVTFEDTSRTIRSLSFSEDLNEFEMKTYEAWYAHAGVSDDGFDLLKFDPAKYETATETAAGIYGQDLIFHGKCDGARCDEDGADPLATIAVRGLFADVAASIGPLQDYSRSCRYRKFKGEECKYVGPETYCKRTWEACVAYNNTINFGGFRFALEPPSVVQWGTNEPEAIPARYVPPYEPTPPPAGGGTPAPRITRRTPTGTERPAPRPRRG